jgi:hypothetical protein
MKVFKIDYLTKYTVPLLISSSYTFMPGHAISPKIRTLEHRNHLADIAHASMRMCHDIHHMFIT